MKITKKILSCFLLVLFLTFSAIPTVKANDMNTVNFVDLTAAKKIAINHIKAEIKLSGETTWKSGIKISKTTTLYDLDNNPSAYLFELVDKNENSNGYIITSADRENNPIIEFSYEGTCFLNKVKEKQ